MLKPIAPCINCGPEDRTDSCHSTCEKYAEYVSENEAYRQKVRSYRADNNPIYSEGRLHILNRNMKGGKH